jgi:hypothetical protein
MTAHHRQIHRGGTRRSRWGLALAALAMASAPLLAHHSYGAIYLEDDTIELEGEVVEFQFKNPHSWIFINAEIPFSGSKMYGAEWASTSRLDRDDITRNTLHVGDRVRIWASPNRDPKDNRVRLKRIERPSDHWRWGGNSRDGRDVR